MIIRRHEMFLIKKIHLLWLRPFSGGDEISRQNGKKTDENYQFLKPPNTLKETKFVKVSTMGNLLSSWPIDRSLKKTVLWTRMWIRKWIRIRVHLAVMDPDTYQILFGNCSSQLPHLIEELPQ